MKILITGGTGFLGRQLVEQLLSENHYLVLVTRQNPSTLLPFPGPILPWPITSEYHETLKDIDAVIHLAGEPVAERWSKERKQRIYDSRVQGTREIVDLLPLMPKVHTFICGSGIGFYGNNSHDELTEESPPGEGFLAEICKGWEAEAAKAKRPGLRVINLRTGVVLGRSGGALSKLEPFFMNQMGGPAGDGSQQMSWIHEKDWVQAVSYCLRDTHLEGPINLTAPEPVSNRTFATEMARIFGQNHILPAPAFALQLALGEMACIALEGQRVLPKKLLASKFKFQFTDVSNALEDVFDINETRRTPDLYFYTSQWVPTPREKVFDFFKEIDYLEKIIPESWQFKVLGRSTKEPGKGTIYKYDLRSHGLQIEWHGEITEWNPPDYFVDVQVKGPYARYQHEHTFISACGGTIIRDKILYRLPLGTVGRLATKWLSERDQIEIFAGRKRAIAAIFSREHK